MSDDLARRLCDPDRLARWLDGEGLAAGLPLDVARITTGHSNETFLVRRGGHEWILRRPPRVPLAPTAHDMAREARLLRALATAVPAPRLAAACLDPEVIGAPFHLTERLDGVVVRETLPAFLRGAAVGRAFMEALATLHAADWGAIGLAARTGVTVLNAPGTIDSDYRGEVQVLLVNLGSAPAHVRRGDRIAQLVVGPVASVAWQEVAALPDSIRGSGGFGSTDDR